jgi:Na+/alanine symporter
MPLLDERQGVLARHHGFAPAAFRGIAPIAGTALFCKLETRDRSRETAPYRYIFCVFVVLGAIGGLNLVWTVASNLNALMAIPNLVGLLGPSNVVTRQSRDYINCCIHATKED